MNKLIKSARVHVLVLDDDKKTRDKIKSLIKGSRVHVQKCLRPSDAINSIFKEKEDILIADVEVWYEQSNPNKPEPTPYQIFKAPDEPFQRSWTGIDVMKYATKHGLEVIVFSSYKPDTLPSDISEFYVKKTRTCKGYEKLKDAFKDIAIGIVENRKRKTENMMDVLNKRLNALQITLAHIKGYHFGRYDITKYIPKKILTSIEEKRLTKKEEQNLETQINDTVMRLDMRKIGLTLAVDYESSKDNLEKAYIRMLCKSRNEQDFDSYREAEIIRKYLKK